MTRTSEANERIKVVIGESLRKSEERGVLNSSCGEQWIHPHYGLDRSVRKGRDASELTDPASECREGLEL